MFLFPRFFLHIQGELGVHAMIVPMTSLNPEQKAAVEHTNGPLLILAGAGAGKTKTVTHRILHLIKNGVEPRKILAITFTNKAAKEMQERVATLLREDRELNRPISFEDRPFVSTFHALGVHILRENSKLLGIPRSFTILDRGDSLRIIKEALRDGGLDPKNFEPAKILGIMSREKSDGVTLERYEEKAGSSYMPRAIGAIWHRYEAIKKEEKSLDFDDLLLKTAELLKSNEDVRRHYQNVWSHIHVDEYQDTNEVQYRLTKLLAEKSRNLCVVGDIDQNIYSWRGASIKNILDFEKDYPDAKVVVLEQNYRSTQTILTVANRVIEKNKMRRKKTLFTKNVEGERIGLYEAYDENDEARFIASKSAELIGQGVKPEEIAVLYRANFQSRALEEAFLGANLPYQVLGVRFFERKEVKDVVAYLRAALDETSLADIKRIINIPPRGLGKAAIAKIFSGQEGLLPAAGKEKVRSFRTLLARIREATEKEKLSQVIKFILKESGIEDSLRGKTEEDTERLENLRELVTFATRYDIFETREGMEKFLTDVALATDQDELEEKRPAVRLMTVHAAKGLEFDYVFISGLEQDLFPHSRFGESRTSEAEAEEERRLFYVALTRARKKLYLSYTSVRTIYGSKQMNVPSEFLLDVDDEFVEKEESFEGGGKIIYLD